MAIPAVVLAPILKGAVWLGLRGVIIALLFSFWEEILMASLSLLEAITPPEWVSYADNIFQGGEAGFLFWVDLFAIPFGLTVIFSAYGLRFLIRRIPIIG